MLISLITIIDTTYILEKYRNEIKNFHIVISFRLPWLQLTNLLVYDSKLYN